MIFDSQCMIGRRCHKLEFEPWSKADLVSQMDHCGIDRALVTHAVSVEYDPAVGNDLLIEELEGENRLEPVWVLAPHETSSLEPAADMMEKMSVNGVRSVALYPNTHGYPFDEFACRDLFDALVLTRTPVFLSIQETSWSSIRQILSAFPALRLVVTNLGWGALRYVYPMFEEFEELRVDTSGIRIQMGLESSTFRFAMAPIRPRCGAYHVELFLPKRR